MNKFLKIILVIICILLLSGFAYGITNVIKKFTYDNVTINSTYQSTLDKNTINNLWVGTLDLAWKELEEQLGVNRIQIAEKDIPQIVADLNASTFTKDMLNKNDYEISIEEALNRQTIHAKLNKQLTFLETFDNFSDLYREFTFGNGKEYVKYFGINSATPEHVFQNVEVLFYNESETENDFAVKLKTQEGDEIILYRTDDKKTFDEYYEDIQNKTKVYDDIKEFTNDDKLFIPYTKVNGLISYDELLGKTIENTDGRYFCEVTQTVDFYLNEKGCSLTSKATLANTTLGLGNNRNFYFMDTFIIFMKEKNAEQPYFALKVDNDDILEKIEEKYTGPAVLDYTEIKHEDFDISTIQAGEYKFYEDENYEYYYPTHKTEFVVISLYPYGMIDMTAEKALNQGIITIDVLDRYGIEYIKKEK